MMRAALHPPFDHPVPPSGYAWWYLDALSDDGRHGITLIAFVGSVFSPYYALARRRSPGQANPLNHCALNVALYARPGERAPTGWSMTERGEGALQRSASRLQIGTSALEWDGDGLCVHIDEITAPWPSRIRGTVRLHADAVLHQPYALDPQGRHHWCPIAPCARVQVDLDSPGLRWAGHAYLDANTGERPLEHDFSRWDWSRAMLGGGRSAVLYDVTRSDAGQTSLALAFDAQGHVEQLEPLPKATLPSSKWGLRRGTRVDPQAKVHLRQSLEDGPFYARAVLETQLLGETATAVHESLSLMRFSAGWVQCLLPFRMPRRGG